MASLHVTASEFYDLSPAECYYALKTTSEFNRARSRELYHIMRLHAVLVINPSLAKEDKIKTEQELIRFEWEEGAAVTKPTQTVEQMKNIMYTIAAVQNEKEKRKQHVLHDKPPLPKNK